MKNDKSNIMNKYELIQAIIDHEWSQFDKVNNTGGRADCQEDPKTFNIMRRSQFDNWPDVLLASYLEDLMAAEREERNLLAEKYGRMMASTYPDEYENIKHLFPERSPERLAAQEEIIAIEMEMDDEFTARFPYYAAGGRPSRTASDNMYSTSKETYMRGEMSTWSDHTFALYADWVRGLQDAGFNLPEMTADNISQAYGFESVSAAEEFLAARHQG